MIILDRGSVNLTVIKESESPIQASRSTARAAGAGPRSTACRIAGGRPECACRVRALPREVQPQAAETSSEPTHSCQGNLNPSLNGSATSKIKCCIPVIYAEPVISGRTAFERPTFTSSTILPLNCVPIML
jgi:hypothetical protein